MALRTSIGCLLAALALMACKSKGDATKPSGDLGPRCAQLGKTCGDNDKHAEKIVDDCKQAAVKQVEKSCADKVSALYDCYEKEVCGKGDKVWALEDMRVLADRNSKCGPERTAVSECVGP